MRWGSTLPILGAAMLLLGACTRTNVDPARSGPGDFELLGKAGCVGFCPPDRTAMLARMHAHCPQGSVPAILRRGRAKNGLIGTPHAKLRFECLFAREDADARPQIAEIPASDD